MNNDSARWSESMLPRPTLVLSDLHLGHPASFLGQPRLLTPLLKSVRSVIFNGDTCEFTHFGYRERGRRLLDELADLCRDLELGVVFTTGNHDPLISSCHHLDLHAGAIFVTHGDALHPYIAPWSKEAATLRAERERLWTSDEDPATLEEALILSKKVSLVASLYDDAPKSSILARAVMVGRFARRPWRAVKAFSYWSNVAKYSERLRARYRPGCQVMIIGHTHRAGVWKRHDWTLINTGSFQPLSRPLPVLLRSDRVDIHAARRERDGYHLGQLLRAVPLPPQGSA